MVLETFPDVSSDSDLQVQDFTLSLMLGSTAMHSLESSLVTAESNFQSALDLSEKIDFEEASRGLLEQARIRLSLSEIARLRGNYPGSLEHLRLVESLLGAVPESEERRKLELGLALEECAASCDIGDEATGCKALLWIGNRLGGLLGDSDEDAEYRARFLGAVAGLTDSEPELDKMASSLPTVSRESLRSESGMVAGIRIDLARELDKVEEFSMKRRAAEAKADAAKEEQPANPWEKPERSDQEVHALEERRAAEAEAIRDLLKLLRESRELAAEFPDRRFHVLELEAESTVAKAYRALDRTYLALQHFRTCLDRSEDLLRLDGEMIDPLEAQALAGQAIASVYGESGEGGRRLAALETAYQALLEAEARGISSEHFPADRKELVEELIIATIHEFYRAMSSPSALEENSFFADEVRYFGGNANGQVILKNQLSYRAKYPHRLFVVKGISDVELNENSVFTVVVMLDYWVADPEKENDMDYDDPEGEIAQKIGFSFDEGSRLKIVEIGAASKEELVGKK